jgi:hypothetical protein
MKSAFERWDMWEALAVGFACGLAVWYVVLAVWNFFR